MQQLQNQQFQQKRAQQLISLLITSNNPNISQQQAEVTANTIASVFNVSPRNIGVGVKSKKKGKTQPRKTGQTRPYFAIVEENDNQNQPISVSINTDPESFGCDVDLHNGYVTLNMTRRQSKALRYALHNHLQESSGQQQGVEQHDSDTWQDKIQQSSRFENVAVA